MTDRISERYGLFRLPGYAAVMPPSTKTADPVGEYDRTLSNLIICHHAVEASDGWATSVRASRPPMTIMGSLGGVEAGLRQLRRSRPLETCTVDIAPDLEVTAPTVEETLRIKAYLILQRNQVRDYLDVVTLSAHMGADSAVAVLRDIDDFYVDRSGERGSVLTSLVLQLAEPSPRDVTVTRELARYKGLNPRWHEWSSVVGACRDLALRLADGAS